MLNDLPPEIMRKIVGYLKNDGLSVLRMSLCSSNLYDCLCGQNSSEIWKNLVEWKWNKRRPDDVIQNYRHEYLRHYKIDEEAIRILEDVESDLRKTLQLKEDGDMINRSSHVGEDYSHSSLKKLLSLQADIIDILRLYANKRHQFIGFLAARCLQNIHMIDCFCEWRKINLLEVGDELKHDSHHVNSFVLERYAILICQIEQTVPELLKHTDVTQDIVSQLDQIADDCREQIVVQSARNNMEIIEIINNVLPSQYGFVGNEEDYYNYKNSLLHHTLESKKGTPITLCVLYACVCKRLGLQADIVGLPGHVVLGLYDDEGTSIFVDVFNRCNLLSIQDCQRICTYYGVTWDTHFLAPLRGRDVFQRMLNNLGSCLFQAMSIDSDFLSDLLSQQHLFTSIHGRSCDVIVPLIQNFKSKITLSPDLLRYYRLIPRRNGLEGETG